MLNIDGIFANRQNPAVLYRFGDRTQYQQLSDQWKCLSNEKHSKFLLAPSSDQISHVANCFIEAHCQHKSGSFQFGWIGKNCNNAGYENENQGG